MWSGWVIFLTIPIIMTILHFLRFSIFRWRTDWESTPYPKPPPWSTFRWHHFVLPVTVFDFLCFFFTLLTSTALLSPQLPPSSSIFLYSRPLGIDTENFYLLCKWMGATDSKTRICVSPVNHSSWESFRWYLFIIQ